MASALAATVASSDAIPYLSGRLNLPGFEPQAFIASLICALILGALVVRIVLVADFDRRQAKIKLALAVIAFAPFLLMFTRHDPFDVFVNGFARWAQDNKHLGDSRNRLIADAATTASIHLPMEWPHSEGSPSGIRIDASKWPSSFQQESVNDVWVVNDGLLLVWDDSIRRFVYYSSNGMSPPELESPILVWQRISEGAWVGVCYPH